jgi:outer membrane protein assembly factor BamE (lipoprotein component of BamABCDE complex)
MKKIVYLLLILLFIISCQRKEVIKTHGISYLEKREKLIFVNKTNKNDTINIFGQPSTKGMTDENLWIYIERTITRGKILKLGRNLLKKNNVLVLEFDKYGVLKKKDFYNIHDMKKLTFEKNITENEIRKENFIYSFLSSIRQKMQQRRNQN